MGNVWNWDEEWKVEWMENGSCMGEMRGCEGLDGGGVEGFWDGEKMGGGWVNGLGRNDLFKGVGKDKKGGIEVVVRDGLGCVYKEVVKE